MSSELLRRAATLMRERASAATSGPWQWGPERDNWGDAGPNLETVKRGPVYSDGSQGAAETVIGAWGHDAWGIDVEDGDAAHIAAWHPAVALAVADWLDATAELLDHDVPALENHALAVARAYLGEQP